MSPVTRLGVSLLSGGLDSTTVTTYAKTKVDELYCVTFRYGQNHSKEIDSATRIARILGLPHKIVDISDFRHLGWYSSITNPDNYLTPQTMAMSDTDSREDNVPITYVPLRNSVFMTMAGALLESMCLDAIERQGVPPTSLRGYIFAGPNAIDYSGYPDCRPEFYSKIQDALMCGSKLWNNYGVPIDIETPIIELSKAQIVDFALQIGAPIKDTWTCYFSGIVPCGCCDACVLRAIGFKQSGNPDPILG